MKTIPILLFVSLLMASFAYAVPGDWKGEVSINGTAAAAGVTVAVYTGTTLLATTTTPTTAQGGTTFGNDFYLLAFETTEGTSLTFNVCGISANTTTFSSGTHTFNIALSTQDDGTSGCTCGSVCAGGYCYNPGLNGVCSSSANYYCNNNGNCDSSAYGETSSNCPNDCSSGGGGGGGGGSSSTTTSTYFGVSVSSGWSGVPAGNSINMDVDNANIPIESVTVTVNDGVTNVLLTVSELTSTPPGVPAMGSGVYKYMQIDHLNLPESSIGNTFIDFKVPKSWLTANSMADNAVSLYRYNTVTSAWDELTTTVATSDADYVYYRVETTGLSVFAVAKSGSGTVSGAVSYTAFQIIDAIRAFYAGSSTYTAFDIINMIRAFYGG